MLDQVESDLLPQEVLKIGKLCNVVTTSSLTYEYVYVHV
jgi:hypothetical protein